MKVNGIRDTRVSFKNEPIKPKEDAQPLKVQVKNAIDTFDKKASVSPIEQPKKEAVKTDEKRPK